MQMDKMNTGLATILEVFNCPRQRQVRRSLTAGEFAYRISAFMPLQNISIPMQITKKATILEVARAAAGENFWSRYFKLA